MQHLGCHSFIEEPARCDAALRRILHTRDAIFPLARRLFVAAKQFVAFIDIRAGTGQAATALGLECRASFLEAGFKALV